MVKNPPANAGDSEEVDSIPGSRRSPRVGNSNPLQYFCLENSMDRGVWWATIHGVPKSWTCEQLSTHNFSREMELRKKKESNENAGNANILTDMKKDSPADLTQLRKEQVNMKIETTQIETERE